MESLIDKIETPVLKRLYAYWETRRGAREFPARRELDPVDFRYALGSVLLLDVEGDPPRFRFRLHGSELALRAGYDMTGKYADELPEKGTRAVLVERCRDIIETRQPVVAINERLLGKRVFGYEALWMPLSSDGVAIDMLMGALVYRDSRAAGPVDWTPVGRRLSVRG